MPAVVTVKEGINLPRYPSVPGRHARQAQAAGGLRAGAGGAEASDGPPGASRGSSKQAEVLATAPTPRPRVVDILSEIGVMSAGADPRVRGVPAADALSQQAVTFAGAVGDEVRPVTIDRPRPTRPPPGPRPWSDARQPRGAARCSPPAPIAATRCSPTWRPSSTSRWRPTAFRSTPGDPASVIRMRWGGSLLEEAQVHGPPLLFTAAPARRRRRADRRGGDRRGQRSASEPDRVARVVEQVRSGRRRVAGRCRCRRLGRARRGLGRRASR